MWWGNSPSITHQYAHPTNAHKLGEGGGGLGTSTSPPMHANATHCVKVHEENHQWSSQLRVITPHDIYPYSRTGGVVLQPLSGEWVVLLLAVPFGQLAVDRYCMGLLNGAGAYGSR